MEKNGDGQSGHRAAIVRTIRPAWLPVHDKLIKYVIWEDGQFVIRFEKNVDLGYFNRMYRIRIIRYDERLRRYERREDDYLETFLCLLSPVYRQRAVADADYIGDLIVYELPEDKKPSGDFAAYIYVIARGFTYGTLFYL